MVFRTPISSAFTLSLFALMAVSTKGDFGCYNFEMNQCSCERSVCNQASCEAQGGAWTGGCGTCSCLCPDSETNTFTVKVDLFAGALGYFSFEECDEVNPNPTLQMKVGEVYTFDQTDISNYYHPMGFAYDKDGALTDSPELEPGVASPNSTSTTCVDDLLCPAPIYYKNGVMLESYTNLDDSSLNGTEFFGLDSYEPEFFYPLVDWSSNEYTIKLRYNDATVIQDFFYFCHIHEGMSGRIILLDDEGNQKNGGVYEPALPRSYYDISFDDFDVKCGTHLLAAFTPDVNADFCPETFVCDSDGIDSTAQDYAECIDAMNCLMMLGMTTNAGDSPSMLFLQQMIPHHANAVQMAKSLLKVGELECGGDYEEESSVCILEGIAREIITNQNFQIQTMIGLYEEESGSDYADDVSVTIDCDVEIQNSEGGRGPGICFSAFTTAFVNGKGSVTMDLIEVGDSVLTGNGEFQSVYSIDHRDINKSTTFLQIAFGRNNNVLEITPNHMIFKQGSDTPVASATVTVGDRVATPSGYEKVNSVKTIERKGVFNPLTADGTIVASGMVASTFSSLLNQSESIEISGSSIMSYQQFFKNLLKPYKFFCTTLSLELCRVDSGKVMVSGLASRIFFFHYGDSAYQASLLSTIAFLLSIMENIVIPLFYISIPLGICKLVSAGKK